MTSLPNSIKVAKQLVRQHFLAPVSNRIASRRLAQFVESFREGDRPDSDAIARLRRAWGNEAYSADAAYIAEVVTQTECCAGPILECGSGLTTLVAALVAERHHETVWSLEQDADWAKFVKDRLHANAVKNVEVIYAPLRNYGEFVWYDMAALNLPRSFGLALCDGPAVLPHWGESHHQWRYGLLPVLLSAGISIDAILLDDADEPRATNLLERWMKEFAFNCRMMESRVGSCAVLHRTNTSDA